MHYILTVLDICKRTDSIVGLDYLAFYPIIPYLYATFGDYCDFHFINDFTSQGYITPNRCNINMSFKFKFPKSEARIKSPRCFHLFTSLCNNQATFCCFVKFVICLEVVIYAAFNSEQSGLPRCPIWLLF